MANDDGALFRPAFSFALAPQMLTQPVNSGWSFGNVVINAGNSSAPDVERAVVSRHSYGRQIGRLIGAVEALVDAVPRVHGDERVKCFRALADEIDQLKREARRERLLRLREDLEKLKADDPSAFKLLAALLRPS